MHLRKVTYLDNLTAGQIFLNTSPGPPFPPNVSLSVIDGVPIPEPSSMLFLGTGVVCSWLPLFFLADGKRRFRQPDGLD
jgi:hypothetical protein